MTFVSFPSRGAGCDVSSAFVSLRRAVSARERIPQRRSPELSMSPASDTRPGWTAVVARDQHGGARIPERPDRQMIEALDGAFAGPRPTPRARHPSSGAWAVVHVRPDLGSRTRR